VRYVVGVAGPAGGGKTSLVEGLVRELVDAASIHMDDYERMTLQPAPWIAEWAARGADLDEYPVPLLGEHLERLKRGLPVERPASQATITPRKYLLFETQLGRAHRATGALIDMLVWIDTPLEIALARVLKDVTGGALRNTGKVGRSDALAWLDTYLESYLALVRHLMILQRERVRPQADVIVDGCAERAAVVREVRDRILRALP